MPINRPAGPVGLLINSLQAYDATLTPNLIIARQGEADIDLWNLPWQHLKRAVVEMAAKERAKQAGEERAHLANLQEIDGQISKKIVQSLGDKEKKVYNQISTGGAWSEAHLEEIGLSQGKCTHCGQQADDISHVTWHCPAVNKHRTFIDLKGLNPDALPCFIKHGVPKAMSTNVESTFWGDEPECSNEQCNEQTLNAIGMQVCNRKKVAASCKHQEIKDVLSNNGINLATNNARQSFQQIKVCKQPPHLALPYRCRRPAPIDINVYTDGSWINPLQQYLGLGGASVWWPGRNPAIFQRLSTAEKELGHAQQFPEGLMLYTPIGGYSGSSTRTELAAAIIAIVATCIGVGPSKNRLT